MKPQLLWAVVNMRTGRVLQWIDGGYARVSHHFDDLSAGEGQRIARVEVRIVERKPAKKRRSRAGGGS